MRKAIIFLIAITVLAAARYAAAFDYTIPGAGHAVPKLVTSNYIASPGDILLCDTSAGPFTVTLPANPPMGSQVKLVNVANSWGYAYDLTISGNGANINGSPADLVPGPAPVHSGYLVYSNVSVTGVFGSTANTTDGTTPITADTLITGIHGYTTWTSGDSITLSGKIWNGTALDAYPFQITQTSTVQDLLDAIETAYGQSIVASVTPEGKIEVLDQSTRTSQIALTVTANIQAAGSSLSFGTFVQGQVAQGWLTYQGL